MSTEKIYQATIKPILYHFNSTNREVQHLDIGSGTGELVKLLKGHLKTRSSCCDYTDTLMKLPNQRVEIVNLNTTEELPFPDSTFDLVTATEVIEHLENFRSLLREIHRVLKPGGVCVLSTPNVLNLNSRLRNLWFGFAELMGPLPVHNRAIESCAGHINPISLFYVMHALHELNFNQVDVGIDKYQRSSLGKAIILWLPIKIFGSMIFQKEMRKYKTINNSNKKIVRHINSLPILSGRTIIVSGVK